MMEGAPWTLRFGKWLGAALVFIAVAALGSWVPAHGQGKEPAQGESVPVRWVIDASRSEVAYHVSETFLQRVSRGVAVGVTRAIEGEIFGDPDDLAGLTVGPVRVDISRFTSDQPRRDERIRHEWLESARYPIAEFVTTDIESLATDGQEGDVVPVRVHGELTVRDVTRPVTWEGVLTLGEGVVQGALETQVLMTDFDFDPPAILGVLRADNEVRLVFNFTAVPAGA